MHQNKCFALAARALIVSAAMAVPTIAAKADGAAFIPQLIISSTIPANGDLNPYGVAFVPDGFPRGGAIAPGDVLVSNFNNSANLQGTGTTIIKLTPNGAVAPAVAPGQNGNAVTFFHGAKSGLTTALGVLQRGFVVVGNVPTTDGTFKTISNGALEIVDRHGNLVSTLVDSVFLDSPWDLTINDNGGQAQIFVSNVLSGTVSRLDVSVSSGGISVSRKVQLAFGYTHMANPTALVLGPTGLAYDARADILYVASTADNEIFAIMNAGKATSAVNRGKRVFSDSHLRGPLALALAPNGDLLTANGDAVNADPTHPSEIVEFTASGRFVAEYNVDAGQGGAFGIATGHSGAFDFIDVDDNTNSVTVSALPGAAQP